MWGGGSTWVSAASGLGNTTIVATQAPISEANVITTHEQTEVDGASSVSLTVRSTRLPATCTQAPIGSLQATIPSSGGGSEPMYLSLRAASTPRRCGNVADPYISNDITVELVDECINFKNWTSV